MQLALHIALIAALRHAAVVGTSVGGEESSPGESYTSLTDGASWRNPQPWEGQLLNPLAELEADRPPAASVENGGEEEAVLELAGDGEEDGEEGDDDEDEDEFKDCWRMTYHDKVWLQVGWVFQLAVTVLVLGVCMHFYEGKGLRSAHHLASQSGVPKMLYEALWGGSPAATYVSSAIISMAILNFAVFSFWTERKYELEEKARNDEYELFLITGTKVQLVDVAGTVNTWVQVVSVIFFATILVLRLVAAGAHPVFCEYGIAAPALCLCSFYSLIDAVALIPTILSFCMGQDYPNFIWLSIFRSMEIMQRQPSTGAAVRRLRFVFEEDGAMIGTMFAFGGVCWIGFSGLYFLANIHETGLVWEATVYLGPPANDTITPQIVVPGDWVSPETGTGGENRHWERFESIPAAAWFVLVNLCKENPLAEFHTEFFSRLLVMLVCFCGVPIFALPAGVLGNSLQKHATTEMEQVQQARDGGSSNAGSAAGQAVELADMAGRPRDNQMQALENQGQRPAARSVHFEDQPEPVATEAPGVDEPTHWLMPWLTGIMSFGSVFVYMIATVTLVHSHDQFQLFRQKMTVSADVLAISDGVTGAIFFMEWCVRLGMGGLPYLLSMPCLLDILASVPGLIHLCVFLSAGVKTEDTATLMDWLIALCVLRVLKLERYIHSFRHMWEILAEHAPLLKATSFITCLMWMVFSTLLYYTDADSYDGDLRANYGSVLRSLWAEAINLHGEWVWCDYSSAGKGVCAIIALFSSGIFMIPVVVFSDGFTEGVADADVEDAEDYQDPLPWQSRWRPAHPGQARDMYDLFYGHLVTLEDSLDTPAMGAVGSQSARQPRMSVAAGAMGPSMSMAANSRNRNRSGTASGQALSSVPPTSKLGYLIMRKCSLWLTTTVSITTIVASWHADATCEGANDLDWCEGRNAIINYSLQGLDCIALVFFIVEFLLRTVAVPAYPITSIVGLSDVASIGAIFVSTIPWCTNHGGDHGFRHKCFNPSYGDSGYMIDDMIIPLRFLRLICYENYIHSFHIISCVCWRSRVALTKSGYATVCVWFIFTVLLYLLERDDKQVLPWSDNFTDEEQEEFWSMAQRYKDVLTGLQYALVHLTGDYPITEYNPYSVLVHIPCLIAGMCCVAAFTGIFVAGFVEHLKGDRNFERKMAASKTVNAVFFTVILMQRKFRRLRERRALRAGRLRLDAAELANRADIRLRSSLRAIIKGSTPEGQNVLVIIHSALLLNVFCTCVSSIPEIEHLGYRGFLNFIETGTGLIFLSEYCVRILAATNRWEKTFKHPMRLLDLFCLIPTFARLFFDSKTHSWNEVGLWDNQLNLVQIAQVTRVVRIIEFPAFYRTGRKVGRAVIMALESLFVPGVLAYTIWLLSTSIFMWVECYQAALPDTYGPEAENMRNMPNAMYWTSIFIIGEWADVDFSSGAGSRVCIFYCLFGVAFFAVPVGLMMEAVESTMTAIQEEQKLIKQLMTKRSGSSTGSGSVK